MSAGATPAARILLVEDDPQVRRYLRAGLPAHGYRLLEAATGEEAIRMAAQFTPEVVLLDLGLPDLDGVEVARRLRDWSHVPILVLSARGQEDQKVEALDAGADDYLTKPFGFAELVARIRAALRRESRALTDKGGTPFECGRLRIDVAARRVFAGGTEVHLTPLEYKLLLHLARHIGKVVTHRHLLTNVWGPGSAKQSHYLRVYMANLRRKLEADPLRPKLLVTEAGVGYRLQCPEGGNETPS